MAESPVRVLVMDRQDRGNALDAETARRLIHELSLEPPPERRCYLLYGAGRVFSAGADLTEAESAEAAIDVLVRRVVAQPLPVIAWLNGPAVGAGAALALLADLRLAGERASLRIPAVKLGIGLPPWYVNTVASVLGRSLAASILLAGREVDRARMLELGVAIESCPDLTTAERFAAEVAALAPLSVSAHRRSLQGAVEEGADLADAANRSDDLKEGIAAFLEKRPPRFMGR